ncbi:MAG: hypothetical protein EPN79_05340 [Burkholderiaceae bacterium]|nr:MAG: hypothetical protein EPN79_05340 [Burkholderiaceae bacterium]
MNERIVNAIDWDHWRFMAGVKLSEACALSLDIDPESLKTIWEYGMTRPAYRRESFPDDNSQREFNKRLRVLESHQRELKKNNISDVVLLPKVAVLGTSFGWEMPSEMGAMCELVAPPKCMETPEPQAASVVPENASDVHDGEDWQKNARVIANKIIERQTAKDLYPNQETIADEIAKKFRSDGIVGSGGKPLTGAYIKRHALKGISSAQGRQLSTSTRRGK